MEKIKKKTGDQEEEKEEKEEKRNSSVDLQVGVCTCSRNSKYREREEI